MRFIYSQSDEKQYIVEIWLLPLYYSWIYRRIKYAKFFLPALFCWYFPWKVCHIIDKKTVCNFTNVFIFISMYPSINITYHRYNTICNSIRVLTVAVTLTLILFQLFRIYRQMWSLGNPVHNILKKLYWTWVVK